MLFNSHEFLLFFLPMFYICYLGVIKIEKCGKIGVFAKLLIVSFSLLFYSWWEFNYLFIILSSIAFNYVISGLIFRDRGKFALSITILGVLSNLALLGYFKYADFSIEIYNFLSGGNVSALNLLLPLAISFFTFQQISYLVDCYKREIEHFPKILDYCLFVTFFPQLIAGPIVHHKEMMPQFESARNGNFNYSNFQKGILLFSIGLFKKLAIADTFAVWVSKGFESSESLSFIDAWSTSLSYTYQLYFDFSGYSDMALGLALMCNIVLPTNFNSPYRALSIQDFWRRWHMTLSRWLRDYIYIPLGGNRKGEFRTYMGLFLTFLIGGIWHGAGVTFIIWGALHGIALCIHRAWRLAGLSLPKPIAWLITFNFVNAAWVFFRAEDTQQAFNILKGMTGMQGFGVSKDVSQFFYLILDIPRIFIPTADYGIQTSTVTIFCIVMATYVCIVCPNSNYIVDKYTAIESNNKKLGFKAFLLYALTSGISFVLIFSSAPSEFLYFNF